MTESGTGDQLSSGNRPPSVNWLAQRLSLTGLPAPILVDLARSAVAAAVDAGDPGSALPKAQVAASIEMRRLLQPVINATGVLLHTNMGRAPIAVQRPAGYTNLELDLAAGQRGDRSGHAARLLAQAAGAEAALIVNNGAAAIFLVLASLAAGREVIVSRGELVEIGGGFRIPEVLESSGRPAGRGRHDQPDPTVGLPARPDGAAPPCCSRCTRPTTG